VGRVAEAIRGGGRDGGGLGRYPHVRRREGSGGREGEEGEKKKTNRKNVFRA